MRPARQEIRSVDRAPFLPTAVEPDPVELDLLGHGVTVRVVYDQSGMCSDTAVAKRRAEIAAGQQARILPAVPMRLTLIDDRIAALPLWPARPLTDGVLLVHRCALLDALTALFELLWQGAVPFTLGARNVDEPSPIKETTTRAVLSMLAAGMHDDEIARNLRCSQRTVIRHARHLADLVGAQTRFQAGLHIGRRGWTA